MVKVTYWGELKDHIYSVRSTYEAEHDRFILHFYDTRSCFDPVYSDAHIRSPKMAACLVFRNSPSSPVFYCFTASPDELKSPLSTMPEWGGGILRPATSCEGLFLGVLD